MSRRTDDPADGTRAHLERAHEFTSAGTELPGDVRMRHVKQALLAAARPVTSHQVPFNQELLAAVEGLHADVARLGQDLDRGLGEVNTAQALTAASLDDLARTVTELADRIAELRGRTEWLEGRLDAHQIEVKEAQTRADVVFRSARVALGEAPRDGLVTLSRGFERSRDHLYEAFEDVFRGSREHIRTALTTYLTDVPALARAGPVLDIGCGRGEWLEVLAAAGVEAYGIDTNEAAVERCRALGLDARTGDALAHLHEVEEGSLGAVTGFHIAEHLPLDTLVELLDAALVALRPGGLLVLESPNPTNVTVGAASFYIDPTHQKPLHPDLLQFLALHRGFAAAEIRYLHAAPDEPRLTPGDLPGIEPERAARLVEAVNWALFGPMDFAVVATRAAPAA